MSDFEEMAMRKLSAHLSTTYSSIATACAALPIPVIIPTGAVSNLEAVPAMRRVLALAADQPMPELHQAELFGAAAHWLGAMDSYSLLIREEFHEARTYSAAANLIAADGAVMDLAVWLADNS
ncbi:hypothetical protein [Streptomyces sp. AM 2-1-1]|uniref:hypothetical protein n=1 Tax=Streptomyces sp. AM 2-1-1 TaxID=3028709 RepID=UPI0023B923EE|nr:hypothetical protein [Streptomyces sp. AM 2-1-1]WEH40782.1 hypothetical protein PZB77_15430 [Streptomyces sp. AM 2-1-1]